MSNRYVRIKDEYLVRESTDGKETHIVKIVDGKLGDALCGLSESWNKKSRRIALHRVGCEECNKKAEELGLLAVE